MKPRKNGGLRKRRTRDHVIADLGVNCLERFVLRCGFTVQRILHDYGLDLVIYTFAANGEADNGGINVQVKATEHLPVQGEVIAWRLQSSDLRHWLNEPMPVILVIYDAVAERVYWLNVQAYCEGKRLQLAGTGRTVTVHVPLTQVVHEAAVVGFARLRDRALSLIQGVLSSHESKPEVP